MTTLPQTTPVRLPQGGALAPAATHLPPITTGGGGGFQMSGADVWRVVRNNMWLIILFVLLFGAGGYGVNELLRNKSPRYTAVGYLQIQTERRSNPFDPATTMLESRILQEQRTQAQLLKTDALFSEIIKKDSIRDCETFKAFVSMANGQPVLDPKQAKEYLRDYFRVSPVPDSQLLSVEAESFKPTDAKLFIEEIVATRLEQTKRQAEERTKEQTSALQTIQAEIGGRLRALSDKVQSKGDELAKRGAGSGVINTKEIDYRALKEAHLKAMEARDIAASEFERVERTLKATGTIPEVDQLVENDFTLANLQRGIQDAQIELELMKPDLPPENPKLVKFQQRIDLYKQTADARRIEMKNKYSTQFLSKLAGANEGTRRVFEALDKQLKEFTQEMSELNREMKILEDYRDQEHGLRELYNQAENKLRDISATVNAQNQSIISVASAPETPELPTFPRARVTIPIAVFIGLCLALGIAFLRELMDDTVRRPSDITRVGNLNMLGIVADEADDPQVAGAQLAIFDAPHSLTAEQFRQLRTRLQHAASLDTTRSIMVTGAGPRDGKTTVAVNLAAGLALNGRKILLVDANFRRPEINRIFGIGNERGFADVLNGAAALEEVVVQSRVPNLSVLAAGSKPVNATELFESQILIDFIDRVLEEYDHVIFDTAPFLVVSDSAAMAPRVDGVVTVVRAHAESRGLLQRMRDSLKQVKAEHLGVVLNAVRAQGGGYYRRNIKTYYDYQSAA